MSNVLKSGSLNLLETSGPVQGYNGIALFLPLCETTSKYSEQKISNGSDERVQH